MIELPLIFLAGVLGSGHCVGMCGGFALAIGGGTTSLSASLSRQMLYTLGRLFTYGSLGAIVACGGVRLSQLTATLVNVPAVLSLGAGVLLLYFGLRSAGVLKRAGLKRGGTSCLAGSLFGSFLSAPDGLSVFLAGLFTGFLPCGLLYGMLALAAATGSLTLGWATMVVFGLGTAPAMLLVGCGGPLLSLAARRKLNTLAAWSVVATGVVSLVRGFCFLSWGGSTGECPFCE